MDGASHGSSRPVRTFPFDLITSYHFAYIFHFFSVIYLILLYVTCVMVNKVVKKKKKKKKEISFFIFISKPLLPIQ